MNTSDSILQMPILVIIYHAPSFITMTASIPKSFQVLACAISVCTLSACGWVDSTGAQVAEITSTDGLRNAQALAINENTAVTAELIGEGSTLRNWTWTADNKNEIYRCAGIDGYDINHAVTVLGDACTSPSECSITIEESTSATGTQFTVSLPAIKSPLAMSYSLSATRDDGAIVTRQQVLCGVSINEAPQALDDNYTVRRNTTLVIDAEDANSLLSNDLDDADFRNSQLQLVITPVTAPLYASQFELNAQGGFVYEASHDAPINASGYTEDSFVYAVTDGLHTVNARAFIKIIDTNEPPEQLQQIPDVVFIAANGLNDTHIRQMDLSQYFWDPDGDLLTFESTDFDGTLGLTLSATGILTADASILDVNQWRATVSASDGIESGDGSFVVTVRLPDAIKLPGGNTSPTVRDIKNKIFTGTFSYDVSTFFSDRDKADQLTFTAQGLPVGIQIRADGVIEGTVDASNTGRSFVQVTAEDGYGGSVTDGFNLTLN